jgi:hypothetical protein
VRLKKHNRQPPAAALNNASGGGRRVTRFFTACRVRLAAIGGASLSFISIRNTRIALIAGLCLTPWLYAKDAAGQRAMDYQRDIQPLFDRYCVACHACFDAPCQLILTHPAGVMRGASKQPVYDGARLEPAPPTRLFIDGQSTADWRKLGFFPVTQAKEGADPTMLRLLDLKTAHPLPPDQALPDTIETGILRHNRCADAQEIDALAAADPHLGMPFALPAVATEELARIRAWLTQGGQAEPAPADANASERRQISRWEQWLNQRQPQRVLLARWLFEHWAFARLHFDAGASGRFFRLVRSATPPGEAIEEIASRFPNSDPGRPFYYRLRPLSGTRVYKTHITFALDNALLQAIDKLFFASDWAVASVPGYSEQERSNPFETFAPIPAEARYRFMLEHAEYFVRTFIRGPVCRGQLASDVIRDHFWVMFQDPASDPYISDAKFRSQADPLLDLPSVEDNLLQGAQTWFESTKARNRYTALRQKTLSALQPKGADMASIWDGGGNGNALLTVFRHHDSAAVKRGWLGQRPFTLWWMDYPLLERSYYNLVVNFDVFGNLAHQAQTRLYFDLIRNGAEQNFLRLLPAPARQTILDQWYAGSGKIKLWLNYQSIDTEHPSAIVYHGAEPKTELVERLLKRFAPQNATPDPINRPRGEFATPTDATLAPLSAKPAAAMPAIDHLPEAALLRIAHADGRYEIYTLIRNRRHSNVAFILGESLRYEPEKDTLTIAPGVATAYPNFMFDIPIGELPQFVATLSEQALGERSAFIERLVDRWGVRRSANDFWPRFHDVNRYLVDTDPLQAGILDLNRYVDFRPKEAIDLDL